jgi:hypothetical protein
MPTPARDVSLFLLSIVVGVALYTLDKSGKGGAVVNLILLIGMAALLIYPALHFLPWICSVQNASLKVRALLVASVILLSVGWFGLWTWPRAPTPPLFIAAFSGEDMPKDYEVAGIKWRKEYALLNIMIENNSERPYDDLNVALKPSVLVATAGVKQNSYGTSIEPDSPIQFSELAVGDTSVPCKIIATDMGYRLRCAHLPIGVILTVTMALVTVKPEFHLDKFQMKYRSPDDPNLVIPLGIKGRGYLWAGRLETEIYSERPKNLPALEVEGDFIVAQNLHKISQHIIVKPATEHVFFIPPSSTPDTRASPH